MINDYESTVKQTIIREFFCAHKGEKNIALKMYDVFAWW